MTLASLADLDRYATGGFPADWPVGRRVYFSPVDNVHGALVALISSATESLAIAMYGFDDQELADAIKAKLADPTVFVALTLDSSQAGGVYEREILAVEAYPNSMVAVGRSEKGQIMHLKCGVVDGRYTFDGSTNWSHSGEALQDNQLTVCDSRAQAHRYRTRIDQIHASMLAKAKAAV